MQSAWNRYQEAVSTLEQLVNTEPDSTTFLENLAEAYRRSGDLQGNAVISTSAIPIGLTFTNGRRWI